jgi:hypothetical protein
VTNRSSSDFGSTLRNLVGDRYLYSWRPGPASPRRYVFDDGTFLGYNNALRHAEELFFQSGQKNRPQETEEK